MADDVGYMRKVKARRKKEKRAVGQIKHLQRVRRPSSRQNDPSNPNVPVDPQRRKELGERAAQRRQRKAIELKEFQAKNEQALSDQRRREGSAIISGVRDSLAEVRLSVERMQQASEQLAARTKAIQERLRQQTVQRLTTEILAIKLGLQVVGIESDAGHVLMQVADPSFSKKTPAWRKLEEKLANRVSTFLQKNPAKWLEVRLVISK